MAAFTIPEAVVGIPLFVPSANNYFEIVEGGLPNGDDCLAIHGATSDDALAVIRAPTTGILGKAVGGNGLADGDQFSLAFWIKPVTDPGTPSGVLMSCKDWQGTYNAGGLGGGGSSYERWWITCSEQSGQFRLTYWKRESRDNIHSVSIGAMTYGAWHFVVFNIAGLSVVNHITMNVYRDNTTVSEGTAVASGAFDAGYRGFPHFAIGGYADGFNGPNLELQLGKISFFDHMLDSTERTLLWHTMTGL